MWHWTSLFRQTPRSIASETRHASTLLRNYVGARTRQKVVVPELCEQLDCLVQLDAEFHEKSKRNVITFITDAEKDPRVMGFSLVDSPPENFSS